MQVSDAQVVEKIDFSLPRMGLITGRITDETGEPIEGVSVYATRLMYLRGTAASSYLSDRSRQPTTSASTGS